MWLLYRNHHFGKFYSPDDLGGGTGELTKDDILDDLNKEETDVTEDDEINLKPEKPVKKEDKEEDVVDGEEEDEDEDEEEEEETTLEDELEDDLKDPSEEDELELITPVKRSEILKKFPTLFKEFPYLEKAYYREQAYTQINPTIADARLSKEKASTLDEFEGKLLSGDIESTLDAVFKHDKNAFYKLVDNYMPTLAKLDQGAYQHVLGNTISHTVWTMVQEANANKNEKGEANPELMAAARTLQQFVFGNSQWKAPSNLAKEGDSKEKKDDPAEKTKQQFQQREFNRVKGELSTRINRAIRKTIEKHIDPKDSMTQFVKTAAIERVEKELNKLIAKDSRFEGILNKMWDRVFSSEFDPQSVNAIFTAYTSKSSTLLATVIKQARNEALKGMGKRVKKEDDTLSDEDKEPITPRKVKSKDKGDATSRNSGQSNREKAKAIPKNVSTLDYLNS